VKPSLRCFGKTARALVLVIAGHSIANAASITLNWSDNSNNESGFRIERKTGSIGSYTQIANVAANIRSYIDSTVNTGITYCYRVRAYNSTGESPSSNEACGTPPAQAFSLTLTKAGTGSGTVSSSPAGINCGATCAASYTSGQVVNLSATPANGSVFAGWSGNSDCADGSVTVNANLSCTATFNATSVNLPKVSINDVSITERNAGTSNAVFAVTLSPTSSQPVVVTYATQSGTAIAGSDFVAKSGTVTFNSGETSKSITISINGDTTYETNEAFYVNLTSATNAALLKSQGVGTILNDDVAPPQSVGTVSTRGRVFTGDNAMIGGFIIEGTASKRVFVRSRGPSMGGAPFNVPGVLANPLLQIFSGQTMIAENDNWQDVPHCPGFSCEGATAITNTGLSPCAPNPGQTAPPPSCNLESAILITLAPGAYTAMVMGADGGTGIGLVEVVEADNNSLSEISGLSTRGLVQSGDNVMIGGVTIDGSTPATVLIRARGPSMGGAPFNLSGVLADPVLQLFSGQTLIAQNDNWQDAPSCGGFVCGNVASIAATRLDPCQPNPGQSVAPPNCSLESVLMITLPPGSYTAMVSGVGGAMGIGLLEVFEIN